MKIFTVLVPGTLDKALAFVNQDDKVAGAVLQFLPDTFGWRVMFRPKRVATASYIQTLAKDLT